MSRYDKDEERLFQEDDAGDAGYEDEFEDEFDEELEEMRRGRSVLVRVVAFFTSVAFLGLVVLTSLPAFRAPLSELVADSLQLEQDIDVKQLQNAVVRIDVVARESIIAQQKSGTGFNIDPRGVIVTNYHVIENAQNMTIKFPNGEIFKADHWSSRPEIDLAVISLKGEGLPAVPLDSSGLPSRGDKIRVVGNPLGLNNIVAEGRVKDYLQLKDRPGRIFTIDAPIFHGNSGSPVFNREGRVVGVVFATWNRKSEGKKNKVGLAIPVQEVLQMNRSFS